MNRTKLISKAMFVLTRTFGLLFLITLGYAAFSLGSGTHLHLYEQGTRVHIAYPFTETSFLILDNYPKYWVLSFFMPVGLYGVFLCLLSNVFKGFSKKRLFTNTNVKHLKRFYLLNMLLPPIAATLSYLFTEAEMGVWLLVALHLFLGIFVFILSEIFTQGLNLQNEHDLYI